MPLGIDAALRYGLHIPPTESIHQSQLENPTPYNTRLHTGLTPTPIANPGLAAIRAAAHPAKVDYLYSCANPTTTTTSSPRAPARTSSTSRVTDTDDAARRPARPSRRASLSPRMQNAAFAAVGLDWEYEALDVDDVVAAVADLRAQGYAGANVTIPHKQAVVAACEEWEGEAVNTLVFRDGRVSASTRTRRSWRGSARPMPA